MVIVALVVLALGATVLLVLARRGWRPSVKIAALGLLGLGTALYLVLGLAETLGGDIAGIQHLIPAAVLAVLMYVARERPGAAGVALLAVAALLVVVGIPVFIVSDLPVLSLALWFVLPSVLTGLLLLLADRPKRGSRSA